jgi:uncharacterized phage protein gp47/JayE
MSIYTYTPPDFLQNQSIDEIHRRMMDALPDNIDKSELQIPWDFTRPSAIEKAEFVEFELNETIKIMFVHWAEDRWLDLHGESWGLTRRPANRAFGYLTVTARYGTVIADGFQFATFSNLSASVIFEAVGEFSFIDPELGDEPPPREITMLVPAQAVEGGRIGNVPPDTIMLMVTPDTNISYVTNEEAFTGGTEAEGDDEYRQRILDAIRYGISYTGRDADYVRWSREIPAVGNVMVETEWAGPGTVRVFLIDANGVLSNDQTLQAVYDPIIRDDDRMQRLAPIGATLTVARPQPLLIDITANVRLTEGQDINVVLERFKANLNRYWLIAATEHHTRDIQNGLAQNSVKYVFIGAELAGTDGVYDYEYASLLVNGGTGNLIIEIGMFPVTGTVILNVIS